MLIKSLIRLRMLKHASIRPKYTRSVTEICSTNMYRALGDSSKGVKCPFKFDCGEGRASSSPNLSLN